MTESQGRRASALESAARSEAGGYPPYNLEAVDESRYRLTLAVAGFTAAEIALEVKEGQLIVTGKRREPAGEARYLHRGIADRGFARQFQLADHVKVIEARLEHGLLHIELAREVPEAMKPRRIAIRGAEAGPAISHAAPVELPQAA